MLSTGWISVQWITEHFLTLFRWTAINPLDSVIWGYNLAPLIESFVSLRCRCSLAGSTKLPTKNISSFYCFLCFISHYSLSSSNVFGFQHIPYIELVDVFNSNCRSSSKDMITTHKEPVMCLKYNKSFKHVVTASENSVSWNELTSLTLILFSVNDETVHDYSKEWQKKWETRRRFLFLSFSYFQVCLFLYHPQNLVLDARWGKNCLERFF